MSQRRENEGNWKHRDVELGEGVQAVVRSEAHVCHVSSGSLCDA